MECSHAFEKCNEGATWKTNESLECSLVRATDARRVEIEFNKLEYRLLFRAVQFSGSDAIQTLRSIQITKVLTRLCRRLHSEMCCCNRARQLCECDGIAAWRECKCDDFGCADFYLRSSWRTQRTHHEDTKTQKKSCSSMLFYDFVSSCLSGKTFRLFFAAI